MGNQFLSQVGSDLVKKYKTRDPFAIADALGIKVLFCDGFGPLKGMYRVVKRNRFIFINKDLDECNALSVPMSWGMIRCTVTWQKAVRSMSSLSTT